LNLKVKKGQQKAKKAKKSRVIMTGFLRYFFGTLSPPCIKNDEKSVSGVFLKRDLF